MDGISRLKKVGVALGTSTYGTPTVSFTRGLAVKDFSSDPSQDVKAIPELRATLETRRTSKGPIDHTAKLSFALDVSDLTSAGVGDFLGSIYGKDTGTVVVGVPTKYKHKLQLKHTGNPSWLNFWSNKDAVRKQVTGFMPANVKFSINAKEGSIPVEVDGILKDESALDSDQSLVFSDEPLLTAHNASVVKLGGADVTSFETTEIMLKRSQEGLNYIGTSRKIGELVSGKDFEIALTMGSILFANETERAKFLANTNSSFELKLLDANSNYIHFLFPEIIYSAFEGPALNDTDVLRLNMNALVTGDSANHFIEILNEYNKTYDTGATIS
jgi:hypothetical protein